MCIVCHIMHLLSTGRIAASNNTYWNITEGMSSVVDLVEQEDVHVIFGQLLSDGIVVQ